MNSMKEQDKFEIRRLAHELWERDGQPNGRNLFYWLEAERRVKAARDNEDLDEGLAETFPASDTPVSLRRTSRGAP